MGQFYLTNESIPVAHGFVEGRSAVSNAIQHIGKKFTLTIDLKDFFDSVTETHLKRSLVDPDTATRLCYEGATRQGLSSSPAAANVAAIPLDREILKVLGVLKVLGDDIVYTRYADDLTFSSDNLDNLLRLRKEVPVLIEKCGFHCNTKKTRIQSAVFGRRIITGVGVDNAIHPRRYQKIGRAHV